MKKIPLHTKILIGMLLGLLWGLFSQSLGISMQITLDYIKPFGKIFVNLLKMVAVPLVFFSLVTGVAGLNDVSKLSRIGGKTILIYLCTTVIAIVLGLLLVNFIRPGDALPQETRDNLMSLYAENVAGSAAKAEQMKSASPLQPVVDMIPDNVFAATTDNSKTLQVVFFALFLGIALIYIQDEKRHLIVKTFEGLNDAIIKIVEMIMFVAPYGVFALMGTLIVEIAGDNPSKALELLYALLWYSVTVVLGLAIMVLLVYPLLLKLFTKTPYLTFFKAIRPIQLLAFSTSSSSATLPVTMEVCEKELGVSNKVAGFVLPLGATVNMDGTSLYQGVATVFIAQALDLSIGLGGQIMIVLTALLASVGSAGVPGAGIVMLVIVLEAVGVPTAGIALILAVDRILDMCRTVVNVTGDVSVALVVAESEAKKSD